jgi:hypothetical protein
MIKVILASGIALFVIAVCAVSGWPAVSSQQGGNKQRLPQPNWGLQYNSGSLGLKKNQWLKAAFSSGQISGSKDPSLAIRVDYLREIYFDPKAEKDSDAMQHMARSGCAYARDLMPKENDASFPETFVVWPISPGAMRRATEHLNARYPVRFVWKDGNTEKELSFSINSCEYASFLANLRWAAGQRWKKMEHELKR